MLVGAPIPISLQLTGREGGLYPSFSIYKADGTIYASGNLSHVADGLYISSVEVIFPSGEKSLYLQYRVFEDISRTQESSEYESTLEILVASDSTELYNLILQKINRLEKLAIVSSVYTIEVEDIEELKLELEELHSMELMISDESATITTTTEEITANLKNPDVIYLKLE